VHEGKVHELLRSPTQSQQTLPWLETWEHLALGLESNELSNADSRWTPLAMALDSSSRLEMLGDIGPARCRCETTPG
jgi:hypothetical protein